MTGLERQEGRGAELRIIGDLELVQLDRREREQRDGQRHKLHGPANRLGGVGRDHRLDARGVDEVGERNRRDDRQKDDRHRDSDEPLQGALQRAPANGYAVWIADSRQDFGPTGRVNVQYSSMLSGVVEPSTMAPLVSSTM